MKFLELIKHPDLLKILEGFQETEQKKKQVGFNLLTVSSYTSHLENFHSDIIAALLNPKGLHGEGSLFLELLIDFLNKNYHTKIDKSNFKNAIVTREKGRIDIWIRDEVSKCAIIIENKINNASDTANQLDNYYNFSIDKEYNVCCIIYLSLGGYKTAPNAENNEVNKLVKNIPAYSKTLPDLYNGWLLKSLTQNIHTDTYTFVYQYAKLIPYLSNNNMNTDTKEEFYEFLSQNKALQTIQSIVELSNNLPGYRAEKFFNSLKGHTPFKKNYRYGVNHWLFENFKLGSNTFKIDVIFFGNGNASILLWNPGKAEDVQKTTTQKILTDIGMLDEFSTGGFGGGMKKDFEISKFSDNIVELDKSLLDVFQRLLAELSKIKE